MRVLITGGCGYVGYSLVKLLLDMDSISNIFLYDNLSRKNLNFFIGDKFTNDSKVSIIVGDILDNYTLNDTLSKNKIDCVVHLAAKVSTPFANNDPHSFDQINNWGTACLVDAIEKNESIKKVIYLSSISVYGHSMGEIVTESTSPSPKTFYGISKMRGEKHIRRLYPQKEVFTLRVGNVFGYNPCLRIDSVINRFIFDAHFKNKIEVHGSGLQNRAFIHVDSLAETLVALVAGDKNFPTLFNRFDCNLSIEDLADTIQSVYPNAERMYIEQHIEMRSIRAASNNYKNPIIEPKELVPLIQEIKGNFTFSEK